ncbi:hypothetical protein GCM10010405_19660 [Streptomyces macrosporus]|uniref:Uncharacterized protein n=1 Tax=Streptomyces macrosporus TaxID=44032 RepID=A0ABN3JPE3_9ACTN
MNRHRPGGYQNGKCGLTATAIHFRPTITTGKPLLTAERRSVDAPRPALRRGLSGQLSHRFADAGHAGAGAAVH